MASSGLALKRTKEVVEGGGNVDLPSGLNLADAKIGVQACLVRARSVGVTQPTAGGGHVEN